MTIVKVFSLTRARTGWRLPDFLLSAVTIVQSVEAVFARGDGVLPTLWRDVGEVVLWLMVRSEFNMDEFALSQQEQSQSPRKGLLKDSSTHNFKNRSKNNYKQAIIVCKQTQIP